MKRIFSLCVISIILFSALALVSGCDKSDPQADTIARLRAAIAPLKLCDLDGNEKTITINQAMVWHEGREHGTIPKGEISDADGQEYPLCMGVLIGYRAVDFAASALFADEVPNVSDLEISLAGPADGAWDMLSFYTARELRFDADPTPLSLESYTFTAFRSSTEESVTFCLKPNLIPEQFYALKNEGATCGHPEMRDIKQTAILNVLSTPTEQCFEVVDVVDANNEIGE